MSKCFTRTNGHWVWVGVLLLLTTACEGSRPGQPYDKRLDPYEQLVDATAEAEKNDRSLLLVFGANWCPDCRKLDHAMSQEPVKAIVDQHFVVLKVDIGNWDRNLNFVSLWESPVANGIPSAVVSNTEHDILYATRAGELANARNMGPDELLRFFNDIATRSQHTSERVVDEEDLDGDG
jgi:thioredoxin 1